MTFRVPRPVRVVGAALGIVGVLVMVVWGMQRRLLYHPGGAPPPVAQVLAGAQEVTLETADGLRLAAWWLPAGPTAVAVLPGNAGNRADRAPTARALHDLGLSVLLVDYRGYGGNPGAPSEDGLTADGRAALQWLRTRDAVHDVVLFGESLGAGVAVAVAAEQPPDAPVDALVLRSPFTSVVDVARAHIGPVPQVLVRDRFPSEQRVAEVDAPVLVLAAERDEVVPFALSQRLAQAADARLVTLDATGHNAPAMFRGPQLRAAVERFLVDRGLLPRG